VAYDATCDFALNGFGAVKVNLRLVPAADGAADQKDNFGLNGVDTFGQSGAGTSRQRSDCR
jgi:hypothetical protein